MKTTFVRRLLSFLFIFIIAKGTAFSNWYNKDINYYKIVTTKSGISRLDMRSLLEIAPELKAKSQAGLQLLYKGKQYPFYYTGNEQIDENGTIWFRGFHAQGDTTYFNNYTNEAVFFLYYDIKQTSLRLNPIDTPLDANAKLDEVKYNYHYEKDVEYHLGYDVLNVETDRFEKWYWKILTDFPGGKAKNNLKTSLFTSQFLFFNSQKSSDAKLNINFSTPLEYGPPYEKYNRSIKAILNYDTISVVNFDSLVTVDSIIISLKNTNLFHGTNELSVLNATADTANTEIGIDYFTFSFSGAPNAFSSTTSFDINNLQVPSRISVPGFSSNKIVIIDTLSNSILFKEAEGKTRVIANIRGGDLPMLSMMINDEIYTYEHSGFHIGILPKSRKHSAFQSSKNMGNEIENLIPSIENGSIIVVAYNGANEIPQYLRNWLILNGGNKIRNLGANELYIASFKTGVSGSIQEFTAATGNSSANNAPFISADIHFPDSENRAYSLDFSLSPGNYSLILSDSLAIETAKVFNTQASELRRNYNADMLIITHPLFFNAATSYADYRRSQGYKIDLINVEDIYKEFEYGFKAPIAIKQFLQYAYNNSSDSRLKYALLIGDASRDPNFNNPTSLATDYIPSYGVPVSDYWYGLFSNDDTQAPELIIARIPVSSELQLVDYLEKVKSYESGKPEEWHKRFLFLNGGITNDEQKLILNDSYRLAHSIINYPLCADTVRVNKKDNVPSGEAQKNELIANINRGNVFTIYNGHASPAVFDLDGWQVQNLSNKDKYGILATLSCNAGAFAEPVPVQCRNEEYLLAKDKGFVTVIGSTTVGETNSMFAIFNNFLNILSDNENFNRKVGDILTLSKQKTVSFTDRFSKAMRRFVTLLGDPLIQFRIDTIPDLFINENEVIVKSSNNSDDFIKENDSTVNVTAILHNAGIATSTGFSVKLTHQYNDETNVYSIDLNGLCRKEDICFTLPIDGKAGEHLITMELDSDNKIYENRKDNNIVSTKFYVYKAGLLAIEPLDYWNMQTSSLKFRQVNQLYEAKNKYSYYFAILTINGNDTTTLKKSIESEIKEYENYIDWTPDFTLETGKSYVLSSQLTDENSGTKSNILYVPFNTYSSLYDANAVFALNSENEIASLELDNMMIEKDDDSKQTHITLLNSELDYKMQAFTAAYKSRFCHISIADSIYVNGSAENRGFNIVVTPKNTTKPIGRYYRFDTFNKKEDIPKLFALLRDTITVDDYVFIATSDRSFNAFSVQEFDILKNLLKNLGSQHIDKIEEMSSFTMLGWKNAEIGTVPENHIVSDTAAITGKATFYATKGKSKTKNIGPATKWNKININGNFDSENIKSSIKVVGITNEKQAELLTETNKIESLDISNIDAKTYPFINVIFETERNDYTKKHFINSIAADYEPAPELVITKNTSVKPGSILRADSTKIIMEVENISLRTSSKEAKIELLINDKKENRLEVTLPKIAPDNKIAIDKEFDTEFLYLDNIIKAIIDAKDNNELYSFNNSVECPFHVYEDTIPPKMEITVDDDIILNKDYITNEPIVEVKLFDNSKLPITINEPLALKINGIHQDKFNTQFYESEVFEKGSDIKARLKIKPTRLEDKENLFIFTCVDGSGNRDTTKYFLLIALNGYIEEMKTNPNPVVSDNLNFSLYFVSSDNKTNAEIDIYNILGKKVKTIQTTLKLRNNYITWDLIDDEGNQIPPGTYFYILNIKDEFWVEPKSGKFIFVK